MAILQTVRSVTDVYFISEYSKREVFNVSCRSSVTTLPHPCSTAFKKKAQKICTLLCNKKLEKAQCLLQCQVATLDHWQEVTHIWERQAITWFGGDNNPDVSSMEALTQQLCELNNCYSKLHLILNSTPNLFISMFDNCEFIYQTL